MDNKSDKKNLDDYMACHECDLLLAQPQLAAGQSAYCPRCDHLLIEYKTDTINRTFAVAIAGLAIFIPAIFFPLLGIEAIGLTSIVSIFEAISVFYANAQYVVATLVFMFTVLIPFIQLVIIIYLIVRLKLGGYGKHFIIFYRYYFHLKEWAMLDVFLLGIIVSLYKLISLADVIYGLGLAAFGFLLLCDILVNRMLCKHQVWSLLEQGQHNANS